MENTSKGYQHLTKVERQELEILLSKGYSQREIARTLGRSHTSIGREIKRGHYGSDKRTAADKRGSYEALTADHKAYVRRLYAKYQGKKIHEDEELEAYVIRGLKKHWNPDEISGAMKRDQTTFYASKTAIYEWLYSEWGQTYTPYLYSKRHKPKQRTPKTERVMIPNRVSISKRPLGATNRSRYGHWEGDTVVSGKKTGSTTALVVTMERKSRFMAARKIPNLRPVSFNAAIGDIQGTLTRMHSLSLDNGIENRYHAKLPVLAFFCDPYSSWQKGGVENANKMIRRYLPKGMDLDQVTPQRLAAIVATINNKPRKILGYKSALQIMEEEGLLRQTARS